MVDVNETARIARIVDVHLPLPTIFLPLFVMWSPLFWMDNIKIHVDNTIYNEDIDKFKVEDLIFNLILD